MTGSLDMNFIWGVILLSVTLKSWIGQIIIAFSPKVAAKLRLIASESEMDPIFFADMRGEAMWDSLILWTLPFAGILLILNNPLWPLLGLVGGGIYLYFTGRGIVTRLTMQRYGTHIVRSNNMKLTYLMLILWGLVALVTIIIAFDSIS